MAEAAALHSGQSVTAIRNLELIEGVLLHSDARLAARVRVTPTGPQSFTCELVSDFHNRAGQLMKKDRVHMRAMAEVGQRPAKLDIEMPEPPTQWQPFQFVDNGPLYHGPALHGVKATTFDANGGWGQLVALPLSQLGGARTGHDWLVPSTLIDAGFYVCGVHNWFHNQQTFSLPLSLESVRLARMPRDNEPCLMAFRCRAIEGQHAIYDFAIFGEDRAAIALVEGHRVIVIKP